MTGAGRFDIGLIQLKDNSKLYHGLIELKVVRDRDNATRVLSKGIDQAYSYSEEVHPHWAEVVAFEMRNSDPSGDPFAGLHSKADQLTVGLESWYLFPSVERIASTELPSA